MTKWWEVPAKLSVDRNIVFSSPNGEDLLLDVFRPEGDEVLPGIVAIVGGGWRQCNKLGFDPIAMVLAAHNYVVASITYRVAPDHKWPACMRDVKTAVRWFRAHADTYHFDPARVGTIGSSAGGHLAAMLAVTPGNEHFGGEEYGEQSSAVQAAVCLCTPTDIVAVHELHKEDKVTVNLLGGTPDEIPDVYRTASPINYVSLASPPCMFIHSPQDITVPIEPTRAMSEKLRKLGVDSPFIEIPEVGHGVRLRLMRAEDVSPFPQVLEFFDKHVRTGEVK